MLIILQLIILLPVIIPLYIYDRLKNKRCHLFGIEGYFGLMGQGKTICMTRRLLRLRKKYGNKIYICTNYGFVQEDFSFTDWHMLFADWDKPLVVAWDEVQNEFNSRAFKSFPVELLTQLTQVRKDNGILLLYSAQRWARVDKVFREFIYYSLDNSMENLINNASGSVFLNLKKADITDLKVCYSDEIVKKFNNISRVLIDKIVENDMESELLKQQRDILLPKLVSGEIRITN